MRKYHWTDHSSVFRSRRRGALFVLLFVAAVVLLCYLFVWQRVHSLRLAERYSDQRRYVNTLKERCETLRFEVEQLSSMQRIDSVARAYLALIPTNAARHATFSVRRGSKERAPAESRAIQPAPDSLSETLAPTKEGGT